jgi:hypothetical protein
VLQENVTFVGGKYCMCQMIIGIGCCALANYPYIPGNWASKRTAGLHQKLLVLLVYRLLGDVVVFQFLLLEIGISRTAGKYWCISSNQNTDK